MRPYTPAPRPYELMVLFGPQLADDALTAAVDAVTQAVTDAGGQVTFTKRDTPWGRRRLAYPIQRFREAFYVLYRFTSPPSQIDEIERDLKLDERIIRYLVVRQEETEAEEEQAEPGAPAEVSAETPAEPTAEAASEQPAGVAAGEEQPGATASPGEPSESES